MAKRQVNSHSLPGPQDVLRQVLPNGIIVLARANFNSPSVLISGYLSAGSVLEPDDKAGLADFVATALMRGTEKHSFDDLFNELETVGASLGFDAGAHTTTFSGRALAEDLSLLLNLLAEVLRQPTFPDDEVEKLRAQWLAGLAIRAQDTAEMADLIFDQVIYAGHPFGRPIDGFPETIMAITRQDLLDFHRRFYRPQGMVIAIVGGIEPKKAVDAVHRALGGWQAEGPGDEPPPLPLIEPLKQTVRRHHVIPGKSQSDIVIGTLGPRRKDPEYLAAALGNSVLGQFGMMGRIGEVVREKAGLAYYAYSSLNAAVAAGSWQVNAGVNPKKVKKAIDLILVELRRFVKDGVTAEELADSQANFIGRLPLSMESNAGVAGALLNIERFDLGLDYYLRYPALVRAVTPDEVLAVAQKYIDLTRLAVVVAGPEA
ncbi:MAG: M16 family metallopeptidase [Anaerolineae bacterium]